MRVSFFRFFSNSIYIRLNVSFSPIKFSLSREIKNIEDLFGFGRQRREGRRRNRGRRRERWLAKDHEFLGKWWHFSSVVEKVSSSIIDALSYERNLRKHGGNQLSLDITRANTRAKHQDLVTETIFVEIIFQLSLSLLDISYELKCNS